MNVVDMEVARKLIKLGGVVIPYPAKVCSFFGCKTYHQAITVNVKLLFDRTPSNLVEMVEITFHIVDKCPTSEAIICWPELKRIGYSLKRCQHDRSPTLSPLDLSSHPVVLPSRKICSRAWSKL